MEPEEIRAQEEVLEEFAAAHPVPTSRAIIDYCRAHPRHAAAIRRLAAVLLETELFARPIRNEAPGDRVANERDIAMVIRSMGSLYDREAGEPADLQDLIDGHGQSAEDVFARINFTGAAARRLVDGRILTPLPVELVAAMAEELDTTVVEILAAVQASIASPRLGMSKAARGTQPLQTSFSEAVKTSDMDDALKLYWLAKA